MNPILPTVPSQPPCSPKPIRAFPAGPVVVGVLALALGGFHMAVFAQSRAHFENLTAQRCQRDQRANPVNSERSDAALKAYCACYAEEMALHTPSDILDTSRSAATPDQVMRLQLLTKQASEKCEDRLQ